MNRILIDADGCPVVDIAVRIAAEYRWKCIILCDTSHYFEKNGAEIITVSKGADSVDFALVNMLEAGDVVVTQDYGLAAMCLARHAIPVSQDGMIYSHDNIDGLLMARHTAKKIRNAGGRLKGNKKRSKDRDEIFEKKLRAMLEETGKSETFIKNLKVRSQNLKFKILKKLKKNSTSIRNNQKN